MGRIRGYRVLDKKEAICKKKGEMGVMGRLGKWGKRKEDGGVG